MNVSQLSAVVFTWWSCIQHRKQKDNLGLELLSQQHITSLVYTLGGIIHVRDSNEALKMQAETSQRDY